jgi:hypothetical protein
MEREIQGLPVVFYNLPHALTQIPIADTNRKGETYIGLILLFFFAREIGKEKDKYINHEKWGTFPLTNRHLYPTDRVGIFNDDVNSHLFSSLPYLYRWLRADAGALSAKILQPDGHAEVVGSEAEEP